MGIKENLEELARRSSEAELGGGEERIRKQHEAGKLTARERIEVLLDPGLRESVRHGVTTVLLGNCSLSAVYADNEDAADLFSRVEAVPRLSGMYAFAYWDGRAWTEHRA